MNIKSVSSFPLSSLQQRPRIILLEFVCVAVAPGNLDGCFGFTVAVVVTETASKGEAEGKEVGKEEAKVSVRIPKERITQGRPFQECKV